MLPVSDFKVGKKQDFNFIGKIKVKILVIAAISVVGLFMAQLVFANKLATDGQKLSLIEEEIRNLEAQNLTLKVSIAQESSLVSISKKAQGLGFEKPSQILTPQSLLD